MEPSDSNKNLGKRFKIVKRVKDNIPGFRDWDEDIIASFDTIEEANAYLAACKSTSEYHPGYGAGPGSIDTSYRVVESE